MRRLIRGALGALLLCVLVPLAQAQHYPDRPIRLILPYGTGGINDISARIVAPQLSEVLGQQVFVDNRPGGAGMIGWQAAARSPADGYTIAFASVAIAANPILFKEIPYDVRKDFTPICLIVSSLLCLSVPGSHSNVTSFAASQRQFSLMRSTRRLSCSLERYEGVPPPKYTNSNCRPFKPSHCAYRAISRDSAERYPSMSSAFLSV